MLTLIEQLGALYVAVKVFVGDGPSVLVGVAVLVGFGVLVGLGVFVGFSVGVLLGATQLKEACGVLPPGCPTCC